MIFVLLYHYHQRSFHLLVELEKSKKRGNKRTINLICLLKERKKQCPKNNKVICFLQIIDDFVLLSHYYQKSYHLWVKGEEGGKKRQQDRVKAQRKNY